VVQAARLFGDPARLCFFLRHRGRETRRYGPIQLLNDERPALNLYWLRLQIYTAY